jgi:hypothetical protein
VVDTPQAAATRPPTTLADEAAATSGQRST